MFSAFESPENSDKLDKSDPLSVNKDDLWVYIPIIVFCKR